MLAVSTLDALAAALAQVPAIRLAVLESIFYLFLAIQECIDLAAHWVADEGWGEADDAGSAFDILADRGVVERDVATALRAAAGLRNRIARGYAMLDYERVHREAQAGIPALRSFLVAVTSAAGC